jgi:EAL domain-containing protein (putative c-di-GMP-specific phosphodiesterase class I)/DNA-binding response OmpR family regulator
MAAPEVAASGARVVPVMTHAARPTTVLVIDDDPALRVLFCAYLRQAGFTPLAATGGPAGLEIIARRPIDLVVCDVVMPGMSGHEFVRALRSATKTSPLPVILVTASDDPGGLVEGLEVGADDFVAKPVRREELVARVRAHVRTRAAWLDTVDGLRERIDVVAVLARLQPAADAEETAGEVVQQLARRTGAGFAGVYHLGARNPARLLAAAGPRLGDLNGFETAAPGIADLAERNRHRAWIDELGPTRAGTAARALDDAGLGLVATAPVLWGRDLVAVLVLAFARDAHAAAETVPELLRDTMADYATVLATAIGPALVARTEFDAQRQNLMRMVTYREFDPVYQPIIDLERRSVVGYEALTRFRDGSPPLARFAEAHASGLAPEFELAAVARAAERATHLPGGAFLALNVSPDVITGATDELAKLLPRDRPVVLEVTEHVPISDYGILRDSVARLGDVQLAIDDTGAGFASMRHILELSPAFAKLDISLVHGAHDDRLRRALASGLVHYAARSGFRLIAEGVEDILEAQALHALGIHMAQGYHFGPPEPPPARAPVAALRRRSPAREDVPVMAGAHK